MVRHSIIAEHDLDRKPPSIVIPQDSLSRVNQ
jgi:hypothetical protein